MLSSQTKEASNHVPVPTPCLVVVDPNGITEDGRTILVDSKGECHTRDIEVFRSNMRFGLTWQAGWILSSDPNDSRTFLYDLQTADKIELPHLEHELPREFSCALSDKPTNDGCIVVVLHPDESTFWYCHVGGDDGWIKHDYDVGSQQYDTKGLVWKKIVIHHLTSCKGKFYFSLSYAKQGVLEFNPHPIIHLMAMHGMPVIVPPNPDGFRAHACKFDLDGKPHQFLAYYYKDRTTITSITL